MTNIVKSGKRFVDDLINNARRNNQNADTNVIYSFLADDVQLWLDNNRATMDERQKIYDYFWRLVQ